MEYGRLEQMMFGNKKYRKESDNLDNPGRRNFLGTTAKGALAVGLAGTGFLKSEEALAYNIRDLPPGFWPEVCKDEELRTIFGWMYTGGSVTGNVINKYTQADISMKLSKWINPNTPLTEPAYWFTNDYYNYKWQDQGSRAMIDIDRTMSKFNINKNSSMYNWGKGINMYFRTWVDSDKRHGSVIETEIYLTKAFILAAGRPESEYELFLEKKNNKLMDQYLIGVMNSLKFQNEVNKLIAGWSIFVLTLNEANKTNSKNEIYNFIRYQIEEPLIEKKVIPKIRGPPYYP